jgi:hypothetical protein
MAAEGEIRSLIPYLIVLALAPAARAEPVTGVYRGICDASAAVALGPDHFVVAEDEHDILKIYRRGTPEPVGNGVDVVDYLGNRRPNGKAKEADIEGAARIGGRIYWMASHGRDSGGDVEETRFRFFATDVDETGPVPTVKPASTPPYKNLLKDMIAADDLKPLGLAAASQKAPEAAGGLNIEGLAATPDGRLLIGFRNPPIGGQAVVVPLTNPAAVIETGATARFDNPIPLDLDGKGIRSIERIGQSYVIVAGPSGPGKGFALYTWSGKAADKPLVIATDFGQTRPEALFEIPGTKDVHVLSDDGDEPVDGKDCKKDSVPIDKKSFRAITLTLP